MAADDEEGRGVRASSSTERSSLPELRLDRDVPDSGRGADRFRQLESTFRKKGIRVASLSPDGRPDTLDDQHDQHDQHDHGASSSSSTTPTPSRPVSPPTHSHAQSSLTKKIVSRVRELKVLFGLDVEDDGEELLDTFMCALKKRILLQGRMYIFSKHVCFSSSLFGYHKLKTIPIDSLLAVRKVKHVGFPNSVELVWEDREDCVKKEFFTSFLSRKEAFRMILGLWDGGRRARLSQESNDTNDTNDTNASNDTSASNEYEDTEKYASSADIGNAAEANATGGNRARDRARDRERETGADRRNLSEGLGYGHMEPLLTELGQMSHEGLLSIPIDRTPSAGEILTPRASQGAGALFSPSNDPGNAEPGRAHGEGTSDDTCNSFISGNLEQPPQVPDIMQKVMEYVIPVHPQQFYDLFLSSKSEFFLDYHAAQGHKNIQLSAWDYHGSMGPVRDLSFVTALKGFRVGPPEALCHQTQRVGVYAGSHIVFETSQVMNDIPYGDHFKVETRWDIFPEVPVGGAGGDTAGDDGEPSSKLIIHIAVPFTKSTMFKKFIEKGATETLMEAYQIFKRLAAQKLENRGEDDEDAASEGGRSNRSNRSDAAAAKPSHPDDLLPQQEEDWEMILERVEPKFRTGLATLRKMQQEVARQNQFSLTKSKHRRNMSIIDSAVLDAIISDCEGEEAEAEAEGDGGVGGAQAGKTGKTDKTGKTRRRLAAFGWRLGPGLGLGSSLFGPMDGPARDRLYLSLIALLLAVVVAQAWTISSLKL
jgi:hypothetical protein